MNNFIGLLETLILFSLKQEMDGLIEVWLNC